MVICLERGADLHVAQRMPLPLKIQVGFTFLVPAHLGSSGHRAIKLVCVFVLVKKEIEDLGPDLQNILPQSYDYLTIMPKLRLTYDGRLIYKTSHEGRKAFLWYDSLAKL